VFSIIEFSDGIRTKSVDLTRAERCALTVTAYAWAPPGMGKGGALAPPLEMCKWVFETPVRNF